jgi:nucleolar protein 53
MGRRLRGAALRSKKRSTDAAKEIVETTAVDAEEGHIVDKADDELFVVDTTAILPSKKQQEKKVVKLKKQQKYQSSAKELAQIQKLVETHPLERLQEMADTARRSRTVAGTGAPFQRAKRKGAVQPNFDLWGGDNLSAKTRQKGDGQNSTAPPKAATLALAGLKPSSHVKKISTLKALPAPAMKARGVVSIDVARPGQSYNPDANYHQAEIQEALRVETKRERAEKESKAPVSQGLSAETRALLLGDTDSEEEDDDNDDNDGADNTVSAETTGPLTTTKLEKRPEKLTRAQRNKQKRVRAEQYEVQERKRQKKLQNAVAEAKTVAKKLKKEEMAKEQEKEVLKQLKAAKERIKGKDVYQQLADENPIGAPTYPVALPNELKQGGGSLRTVKPKGSLVTDRMVSLMDRDMAPKKQLKQRRRVQGKKRKVKVRGKGFEATRDGEILG